MIFLFFSRNLHTILWRIMKIKEVYIMLFELIIFAVVLVILQAVVSVGIGVGYLHWFTSEKNLKKTAKKYMKITEGIFEEIDI